MSRKNLFDISMDNEKETIDADEFITRVVSKETKAKRSALVSEYFKAMSKNFDRCVLKKALVIMTVVFCLGVALYSINHFFELFAHKSIKLIWAAIILIATIFSRSIKSRLRNSQKSIKPSKKMSEINEELGKFDKIIQKELGVSDYATDIDVFVNVYDEDVEDGDRANEKAKLFEEGDNLCIYYDGIVLSIKKDSFEEIVKIDEKAYLDVWNKDTPYDRGRYMQYKIEKVDKQSEEIYKEYKLQGYYSVRFSQGDKGYEIFVPPYDIEPFCDILKLSPKEIY